MVEIEIFGGPKDGMTFTVSEVVARGGVIRVPVFEPTKYSLNDVTDDSPKMIQDSLWKIIKFVTATGALKLKAIEPGMWARINR